MIRDSVPVFWTNFLLTHRHRLYPVPRLARSTRSPLRSPMCLKRTRAIDRPENVVDADAVVRAVMRENRRRAPLRRLPSSRTNCRWKNRPRKHREANHRRRTQPLRRRSRLLVAGRPAGVAVPAARNQIAQRHPLTRRLRISPRTRRRRLSCRRMTTNKRLRQSENRRVTKIFPRGRMRFPVCFRPIRRFHGVPIRRAGHREKQSVTRRGVPVVGAVRGRDIGNRNEH